MNAEKNMAEISYGQVAAGSSSFRVSGCAAAQRTLAATAVAHRARLCGITRVLAETKELNYVPTRASACRTEGLQTSRDRRPDE